MPILLKNLIESGSPPCSPQTPHLSSGLLDLPDWIPYSTSLPTPLVSMVLNGSASRSLLPSYSPMKVPTSSREKPNVIWVRSLVPNEMNSAVLAILSPVRAARGISIIVPN